MSNSVARIIGNSLAALHGPDIDMPVAEQRVERRRAEIEAIPSRLKRGLALTVHDATMANPHSAEQIRRILGGRPVDFIAAGALAAVYLPLDDPSSVEKVHRSRSGISASVYCNKLRAKTLSSELSLGSFVLPVVIVEGVDPMTENVLPVMHQQFVEIDKANPVFPDLGDIEGLAEYYNQLERRYPGSCSTIASFCGASMVAWERRGLLPDLVGKENVVIGSVAGAEPELLLIDTIPHLKVETHFAKQHQKIIDTIDLTMKALAA